MKRSEPSRWAWSGVYALAVVLGIVGATLHAYFEAREWENLTGEKVSTWDMLFIRFRSPEGKK